MSYFSTVQSDSPVHWWRLLEGGGQVFHDIGTGVTHIFGSNAALAGYSGPSSDGGSWFDPAGHSISSFASLASLTSPMSIEIWVWPTGTPASNGFALAWDGITAGYAALLYLTNNHFAFNVNTASLSSTNAFLAQAWYHVVGTWDNTTARLYVNGVQEASQAVAGPHTFANKVAIGANSNASGSSLQSCLSDAAIYSTALSASRVIAHHNAADATVSVPTFIYPLGAAAVAPVTGGAPPADLSAVLAAVRKSF